MIIGQEFVRKSHKQLKQSSRELQPISHKFPINAEHAEEWMSAIEIFESLVFLWVTVSPVLTFFYQLVGELCDQPQYSVTMYLSKFFWIFFHTPSPHSHPNVSFLLISGFLRAPVNFLNFLMNRHHQFCHQPCQCFQQGAARSVMNEHDGEGLCDIYGI